MLDRLVNHFGNINPKLYEDTTRSFQVIERRRLRNIGSKMENYVM